MKQQMFVRSTVLVLSLFAGATTVAGADAMSSAAPADCATAKSTMMHMAMAPMPMPTMDASMSTDKTYYTIMKTMAEHAMTMTKMEVSCATTPAMKTKAEADEARIQQLIDSATSALQVI